MKVVADTNILIGAVLLEDDAIWKSLDTAIIVAPDLLFAELGHVILKYVKLRDYPIDDAMVKLTIATALVDEIIDWSPFHQSILQLAHQQALSYYDAIYLQICLSHDYPLFTFDKKLRNVAKNLQVTLLPIA